MKLLLHLFLFALMCLCATALELEKVQDAVVRIFNMEDESGGTGFVVSGDGHIATNCHVVGNSASVTVVYRMKDTVQVKAAMVIARDAGLDLAIVQVANLDLPPVTLATSLPAKGDDVIALGYPGQSDNPIAVACLIEECKKNPNATLPLTEQWQQAMSIPVKRGIFEDIKKFSWFEAAGMLEKLTPEQRNDPTYLAKLKANPQFKTKLEILQHTAPINHGSSGGPLFDKDLRVIGVNTAGNMDESMSKLCLASHITEFIRFANAYPVKLKISNSLLSDSGGGSGRGFGGNSSLSVLLLIAVAALAVVMFLMVLRKPRMVMVNAMSRVVRSKRPTSEPPSFGGTIPTQPPPRTRSGSGTMRLRGRDIQGLSYDIAFNDADFRRCGGRLVIGRNNDLSQLHLSHDSVSRQHATLLWQGGTVHVEDRNSGNGTKVNGRVLTVGSPPCPLQPGDKLSLGEVDLIYEILN